MLLRGEMIGIYKLKEVLKNKQVLCFFNFFDYDNRLHKHDLVNERKAD